MDSGTLAYETTLVARTEGFSSSLEREHAEGRRGMEPKSWNRTNLHFRVQPDPCFCTTYRQTMLPIPDQPALFAPLCIYARNQQPILGQLPSAVISSTGHPPRTPLPRHKCAPLCGPRRQFGKVFRQDTVW